MTSVHQKMHLFAGGMDMRGGHSESTSLWYSFTVHFLCQSYLLSQGSPFRFHKHPHRQRSEATSLPGWWTDTWTSGQYWTWKAFRVRNVLPSRSCFICIAVTQTRKHPNSIYKLRTMNCISRGSHGLEAFTLFGLGTSSLSCKAQHTMD